MKVLVGEGGLAGMGFGGCGALEAAVCPTGCGVETKITPLELKGPRLVLLLHSQ